MKILYFLTLIFFFGLTTCTVPPHPNDGEKKDGGEVTDGETDLAEKVLENLVPSACVKSEDCNSSTLECTFLGKCSKKPDEKDMVSIFKDLVKKHQEWRCKLVQKGDPWFHVIDLVTNLSSQVEIKKGNSKLLLDYQMHGAVFQWSSANFVLEKSETNVSVSGHLFRGGTGFRAEAKEGVETVLFVCGPNVAELPFFMD